MREEIARRAKNLRAEPSADEDPPPLLELGHRLHRLQDISAPPHLREAALARALATPLPRRARVIPLRTSAGEWAVVGARLAASALVAFGTAYGTVAVSAASLPNSPLYPVKLLVEDIRVAVAPTEQKPDIYVEMAVRRVEETETLLQTGRLVEAERAVEVANRQIATARAANVQSPRIKGSNEALVASTERVQRVAAALTHRGSTQPSLPEAARPVPAGDSRVSRPAEAAPPTGSEASVAVPLPNAIIPTGSRDDQQPLPSLSAPGASDNGSVRSGPGYTLIDTGEPARGQPSAGSAPVVAPVATFGPIESTGSSPAQQAPTATRTPTPTATPTSLPPPAPRATGAPAAPESNFTIIQGRPSSVPPR